MQNHYAKLKNAKESPVYDSTCLQFSEKTNLDTEKKKGGG